MTATEHVILTLRGGGRNSLQMIKALRCLLRLHYWEQHQNAETGEVYEVCSRCDAYRDRGNAAPGSGAAGMTGSGIA